MSGPHEQAPKPSQPPEKKPIERFEDLEISVDDLIYSQSGTIRHVQKIVTDTRHAGGGYIVAERMDTQGNRTIEQLDFAKVVADQSTIKRIEKKPPDIPDLETFPRHQNALKQLKRQLREPDITPWQRSLLYKKQDEINKEIERAKTDRELDDTTLEP